MTRPIAVLYAYADGPYAGLPGVDVWDVTRDARGYRGPHPVVAHPPCERYGRYWSGGPSASYPRTMADDDGCFAHALASVRAFGGVLEHPADSHAWRIFGLYRPTGGAWIRADERDGWSCRVDQGHYGHRARKATWLYSVGCELPSLRWHRMTGGVRLDAGCSSAADRAAKRAAGTLHMTRVGGREKSDTPEVFRDLLVSMARTSRGGSGDFDAEHAETHRMWRRWLARRRAA